LGAFISKYKQSSEPEKNSSPVKSDPPIPLGFCIQKLPTFGLINLFLLELSLGAFHLKSPTGGCAYGISSQLVTPLIKKPCETPEDEEIFKFLAIIELEIKKSVNKNISRIFISI
jgi:hypothetical protein